MMTPSTIGTKRQVRSLALGWEKSMPGESGKSASQHLSVVGKILRVDPS